jgi:IS605 OrfB family transposase
MKLTAVVKLLPSDEQRQNLFQTLERANTACNWISEQAWDAKTFGRVPVHHLTYHTVREQFELTAQLVVRCIGKVVESYKLDKKSKRQFKKLGAVPYDNRILSWHMQQQQASIWLLGGRQVIPFAAGVTHLALLTFQQGESDLVYRKGEFYLYTTCDVPEDTRMDIETFLGVDLGIKNIATDSDGRFYSGKHLLNVRHRHRRLRRKLQKKGMKSAKRKLKQLSGKESRFANDVNHCISKQLVKNAKDTKRGIALEDLNGIRDRVTVTRRQRDQLHNWSFSDLRIKIAYKARRAGIPVRLVDPRNTSRQCAFCGHIDQANRKSQSTFLCTQCGHAAHADVNAAINIGRRGSVNAPNAVGELGTNPAPTASSRL